MLSVNAGLIPDNSFLKTYSDQPGWYTDCFYVDVNGQVGLPDFISAFFTTALFRMERWVLAVFAAGPSSDQDIADLASGVRDCFSLWKVEGRDKRQLILSFGELGVKTWLMIEPVKGLPDTTRLYFGTGLHFSSAVYPGVDELSQERPVSILFYPFIWCHKIYARLLLWSARWKIEKFLVFL